MHSNHVEGAFGLLSQWKQQNKVMGTHQEMFYNYYGMFNLWKNWCGKTSAANFWIFLWVLLHSFYYGLTPDDPTLGHSWGNMRSVGKIVSKKGSGRKISYLVQWKNCAVKKSTWEPATHIHEGVFFSLFV